MVTFERQFVLLQSRLYGNDWQRVQKQEPPIRSILFHFELDSGRMRTNTTKIDPPPKKKKLECVYPFTPVLLSTVPKNKHENEPNTDITLE